MNPPTAELPGYLRFAWMFFMQPISLHHRLKACGIEKPDDSGWRLFVSPSPTRTSQRAYLKSLLCLVLVGTPCAAMVSALVMVLTGLTVEWAGVAGAAAAGMAVGIGTGMVANMALASGLAVAAGAVGATTAGGTAGLVAGVSVGAGVATGAVFGVAAGVASGVAGRVSPGVAVAALFGLLASVAGGVEVGAAFGAAFAGGLLGLVIWPAEAGLQVLLSVGQKMFGISKPQFSPVLWHELSFLPLPFLGQYIETTAELDPLMARRMLDACGIAPGQQKIGRRTLERLQGKELQQIASEARFRTFIETETTWLPPEEGADPVVIQLRQVARLVVAADGSSFAHHRSEHLLKAEKALDGAEVQLLERSSSLVSAYRAAIPAWRAALAERLVKAKNQAAGLLPIPFRAGEPLDPSQGRELFRGREESIREIEAHLALATEARSVALLGPRRTGKSSLLRMLPEMLPDAVCVFFDLQAYPVETPAGFFRALAQTTREQARRSRQLLLPELPAGSPFEAATAWIEALENALTDRRLLICIDEFEALESSFGGSREDLLRLMGLFRATIQHRRKVRLLVAGEAPFDELDAMWDSHFVSVREVRLGHLAPEVAVELVRRPIPSFPEDAIPEPVARRLVERTGAQPFLVQLFAQLLVSLLNDEKRKSATLADLEKAEEQALGQVGSYFRDLWNRAPPPAKEVLASLARGGQPEISKPARRWLDRRCLIDAEGRLTIPVLGRFLDEEVLD